MRKELNYFIAGCADDVEKIAHALLRAVDTAKLVIIDEGDTKDDVRIKAEAGHIFIEYAFSDKKWTPDEEETVTPPVEEKSSLTPDNIEEMFKELDNNDDEDEYI